MEIIEKFSKSLAHIEALYMYVNKGAFKNQCIEELEARWPGIGSKAWSDVENEASKLEPQILVGSLKHQILRAIEDIYGKELAKEVDKRIQALSPEDFRVIVAFSKMWMQGFRTTDEDELSMALEACLGIKGSRTIETLWRVGLINRAHRSAVSRYMPKIYVPAYVKELLEKYSHEPLPLQVNVEEALHQSLIEDPLKACVAVYGLDELIDELVQVMIGLPIKSIVHKLNIKRVMKAGKTCPLIKDEVYESWKRLIMKETSKYVDAIIKGLESSGYDAKRLYDDYMRLPLILSYRDGLQAAMIIMPAILPLKQIRNFNPGALKIALTLRLNAPPQETLQLLRLSSIAYIENDKAVIHGDKGINFLIQILKEGGLKLEVRQA
ncbi:MAG: hypothetical protein ACXQTU_00830 [Candidatus Nezhaarchaeales archaeon]